MRRLVSTFCVIVFGAAMPLMAAAQAGGNETANTSGQQSAGIGDTDSTFVKKPLIHLIVTVVRPGLPGGLRSVVLA